MRFFKEKQEIFEIQAKKTMILLDKNFESGKMGQNEDECSDARTVPTSKNALKNIILNINNII